MDLALEVGVSPRHLSFVETGRSRASPELLLTLAEHLEVPLRERNSLLLAGGFAPRYSQASLDTPEMGRVRETLQRLLASHDPYPGVVIDRYWDVVLANQGAMLLVDGVPAHLLGPPMNVFRVSLHPEGMAARTLNFEEWSNYLVGQLHRSASLSGDSRFEGLIEEVMAYPNVASRKDWRTVDVSDDPQVMVPLRLKVGCRRIVTVHHGDRLRHPPGHHLVGAGRRAVLSG